MGRYFLKRQPKHSQHYKHSIKQTPKLKFAIRKATHNWYKHNEGNIRERFKRDRKTISLQTQTNWQLKTEVKKNTYFNSRHKYLKSYKIRDSRGQMINNGKSSRNTKLKLASLNIRTTEEIGKRQRIEKWLKDKAIDIAMLQETKRNTSDIESGAQWE